MRRSLVQIAISLTMVLAVSSATIAQQVEELTALEIAEMPYQLKGKDIPMVFLVRAFFAQSYSKSEFGGFVYEELLSDIGLESGSNAEQVLLRALERNHLLEFGSEGPIEEVTTDTRGTHTLQYGRTMETTVKGFREAAKAHHAEKSRALANIYHDLLSELAEQDVGEDAVKGYILSNIADHSSLSTDEPLWQTDSQEAEFERHLAELRGEKTEKRTKE